MVLEDALKRVRRDATSIRWHDIKIAGLLNPSEVNFLPAEDVSRRNYVNYQLRSVFKPQGVATSPDGRIPTREKIGNAVLSPNKVADATNDARYIKRAF